MVFGSIADVALLFYLIEELHKKLIIQELRSMRLFGEALNLSLRLMRNLKQRIKLGEGRLL